MIGIIIVGHGNFASEIISIAENIMGEQKCLEAVSVKVGEGEYALRNKLDMILKMPAFERSEGPGLERSEGMDIDGTLILSDIFGGSFSNTCMYFAQNRRRVAVVTGVNLPMVLKVLTYRDSVDLGELVSLACKGGKEGILDACGWLDRK
jgi:PTS system mannose-specific IIA component